MKKFILLIALLTMSTNTLANDGIDRLLKENRLTRLSNDLFLINESTKDFLNYKSIYTLNQIGNKTFVLNIILDCNNLRFKILELTTDGDNWENVNDGKWNILDIDKPIAKAFEIVCPR